MKKSCFVCKKEKLYFFKVLGEDYQSCCNCKTISMRNLPNEKKILEHYKKKNNKDGNYLLNKNYQDYHNDIYQPILRMIKKRIKHINIPKILDIGCFTGAFLTMCKNEGWKVSGYEFQDIAVKIANKNLGFNAVKKINLNKKILRYHNYDVVTLIGVVEHLKNPVRIIKNTSKLIKKNGIILIQTPNSTSLISRILGKFWPCIAPIEHINLFSEHSLRMQFNNSNFRNIEVYTHWKYLTLEYVYSNFSNFGIRIKKIIEPFYKLLPDFIKKKKFYFNGGEMILIAQKI